MVGDDCARARAGARHGEQERHGWERLARARARHGAQEHHDRGQHVNSEFQKNQNRETHDFPKKKQYSCTSEGGMVFEGLSPRLFILTFYA